MKNMAQAVNFMSWWIEGMIGPAQSRETLAYLGSHDIRYFVFMLACQKTGYQAFLPSTRNSDEAHLHLLKATNCTKFVYSGRRQTQALEIQRLSPTIDVFQIPAMKTILDDESGHRSYPYTKSYAEEENKAVCIIHSSGTTGMPKPVFLTNGFFAVMDGATKIPWPVGRQPASLFHLGPESLLLVTTPFFHLMALVGLVSSVFHGASTLVGPEKPLSVEYFIEIMQTTRPTAAVYAPSILEDMSYSDEALACLKDLQAVYFGGAPLAPESGDRLRQYTHIVAVIGTSEIGWIPSIIPEDPADWSYFEWNEEFGVDMQDVGDGLYEMVILRQPNARDLQGIFHTFPDIDTYRTNDIYTRHPMNPKLWKFYGRKDDVIVLSNGEKFNPVEMEKIIEGHPLVGKAVVVGQSRFQPGLLVEPNHAAPEMDSKLFIEEIWPVVQVANQTIAAHGRVMKNKITFASKDKPFKSTPKGTTQRRAVVRDYEKEIDALYAAGLDDDLDTFLPETLDQESVMGLIRQIISHVLEKDEIENTQDFYSAGMDSLMTIQVSRMLQKGIQLRRPEVKAGAINPQIIYGNPTVKRLSQVVMGILEGKTQVGIPREEKIQGLVKKYTADLPVNETRPQNEQPSPSTVILTGSTGSLGTYLLHSLLSRKSIAKVYCLNRSDAEFRQKKSFEEKYLHLDANYWQGKVEFLQASFGEPRFGLDEAKYAELLESVDTIIHNAWKVNFNHSVDSFEDTHIRGVRRFVDFSLNSRYNAHIHFVSSISTVAGWTPDKGPTIPEQPMEDSSVVLVQGYGESKHVAERICLEASRRSLVPTTVHRVGQIAGPTTTSGKWNPHEWLPTIIATSKSLGKIPQNLGSSTTVDWVPVDTLSAIMVEIVHTRHATQFETPWNVFHLTNPNRVPWVTLIPAIQDTYAVEPVEFGAWVAELESIPNPSNAEVAEKPALKLLSFFRGLQDEGSVMSLVMDVRRAKEASATMRSLGPISASLMRIWLRQWQF